MIPLSANTMAKITYAKPLKSLVLRASKNVYAAKANKIKGGMKTKA
jgi:hypothetical protein